MKSSQSLLASFAIFVFALSSACSSSSSESSADSGPAKKTCADLAKCCDDLSEPAKSGCTAAVSGKQEPACAAAYDTMCGGALSDGGSSDGGGGKTCTELAACCATLEGSAQSSCISIVGTGNAEACASSYAGLCSK